VFVVKGGVGGALVNTKQWIAGCEANVVSEYGVAFQYSVQSIIYPVLIWSAREVSVYI
jgi:hypothetical protein